MAKRRVSKQFDKKAIRNWTLYVIRLKNGHYYIGITSRTDFMRRINQHGGRLGARVNQGNEVEKIVEIQHLGKMTGLEAERVENDTMLQYRKRFGAEKYGVDMIYQKRLQLFPPIHLGVRSRLFLSQHLYCWL